MLYLDCGELFRNFLYIFCSQFKKFKKFPLGKLVWFILELIVVIIIAVNIIILGNLFISLALSHLLTTNLPLSDNKLL